MQDTKDRRLLHNLLLDCEDCRLEFLSNVALIADDELGLLDRQVPGVLHHLEQLHERNGHGLDVH